MADSIYLMVARISDSREAFRIYPVPIVARGELGARGVTICLEILRSYCHRSMGYFGVSGGNAPTSTVIIMGRAENCPTCRDGGRNRGRSIIIGMLYCISYFFFLYWASQLFAYSVAAKYTRNMFDKRCNLLQG